MFQQGAWVVSVTGRPWHSVGIDEAHEMLINRECKTSITRPSADYIRRIANYLPYRSKVLQNIRHQLFPETSNKKLSPTHSPFSKLKYDYKFEHNIRKQIASIQSSSIFDAVEWNRGLWNFFDKKKATEEQAHDLLRFRYIGQKEFLLRTAFYILKVPSTRAPNRRRCLQTFSEKKRTNRKISQLEKDRRLVLSAMKRKMQHSKKTGTPIDRPGEQLLEYPLALCDSEGNLIKGQKSYSTRLHPHKS